MQKARHSPQNEIIGRGGFGFPFLSILYQVLTIFIKTNPMPPLRILGCSMTVGSIVTISAASP
jgi:hypothetical protein